MIRSKGFALIEILIAVTILSIILLSVYSGVSSSIYVMKDNKNYTRAMLIAKTKLNEFILNQMRGTDVSHEIMEEFPNFFYTRETKRFEHPMFGPLPAQKTDITISWNEKENEKKYEVSYIFTTK